MLASPPTIHYKLHIQMKMPVDFSAGIVHAINY